MRYGHEVGKDVLGCTVDRDESLFISFKDEPIGTHVSKKSLSCMWTPGACTCGYQPKAADAIWVDDHRALYVRCYECGCQWVE